MSRRALMRPAALGALWIAGALGGCSRSGTGRTPSLSAWDVVINEVVPLNGGEVQVPVPEHAVRAEEFGPEGPGSDPVWHPDADWIELYNPRPGPVSLGGFYLTDNPRRLRKWRFPDGVEIGGTSPPFGQAYARPYLIVWADGHPEWTVFDPETGTWHLHADFSLDESEGETLLLVAPDGETVVDRLAFPPPDLNGDGFPEADVAIVRDPATGEGRVAWQPTPTLENAPAGVGFGQITQSQPVGDEPVRIEVEIIGRNVRAVTLSFRTATNLAGDVPMRDDGQDPDRVAGDGIYAGEIPAAFNPLFEPLPEQDLRSFLRDQEAVRTIYAVEVQTADTLESLWLPRDRLLRTSDPPSFEPAGTAGVAYAVTPVTLAIGEFMPRNRGAVRDPAGRTPDWLEIFNYGPVSVPLEVDDGPIFSAANRLDGGGGVPLEGDPIAPGERRIFWLGVEPPAGPVDEAFRRDGYLPGLGLRGSGEVIAILAGRLVIDFVDYRSVPAPPDVAVGRCPEGDPSVRMAPVAAPTPRGANACGAGNLAPVFLDDAEHVAVEWEETAPDGVGVRITVRLADLDGAIPVEDGAVRIVWGEGAGPTGWIETAFEEGDIVGSRGRRLVLSRELEVTAGAVHRFYILAEDDQGAVAYLSAAGRTSEPPAVEDTLAFRVGFAPPPARMVELHIARGEGDLPSFLEIRNDAGETIDLRGAYILRDGPEGARIGPGRIPDVEAAVLAPGERLVVCLGEASAACDARVELDAPLAGATFRLLASLAEGNVRLDVFAYEAGDVPGEPGRSMVRVGEDLVERPSTPGAPNGGPPEFAEPVGAWRSPIDARLSEEVEVTMRVRDPDGGAIAEARLHGLAYDGTGALLREDVLSSVDPATSRWVTREGPDAEGFERFTFRLQELSTADPGVLVRYELRATDVDGEATYLSAAGATGTPPDPADRFAFRVGYTPPPISINEVPAPGGEAWIEIYNAGDDAVDLGSARLVYLPEGEPDLGDTLGRQVAAGPDTIVPPGGFAVLAAGAIGLDTGMAGELRLYASLAEGNGTIDAFAWPALAGAPEGSSYGRSPDGDPVTLRRFGAATPGEPNPTGQAPFVRGDVDGDGTVKMGDATRLRDGLFRDAGLPACVDAADANDDGGVNTSDISTILLYLFAGGAPPPPPFDAPGADPTADGLGCPAGF